jgi:hypothetical protein
VAHWIFLAPSWAIPPRNLPPLTRDSLFILHEPAKNVKTF